MDLLFQFHPEINLYSLNAITFNINASIFPNGSAKMVKYLYVSSDFWASEGWSYYCGKWQTVELFSENGYYVMGTLDVTNIQFETSLKDDIVACIVEFSIPVKCRIDDLTTSKSFKKRSFLLISSSNQELQSRCISIQMRSIGMKFTWK